MGWGVYDYPSAPEKKTQVINGSIYIRYDFEKEVPADWDGEEIYDDVQANVDEYIQLADMIVEEIDV